MSKGLETLKTIRHIHDMECGKDESINKDFETIEKELRALEIIKNVKGLIEEEDFCEHNGKYYFFANEVNKETYDLLKEELL